MLSVVMVGGAVFVVLCDGWWCCLLFGVMYHEVPYGSLEVSDQECNECNY